MPTILRIGPYRFHFYSREDNEPAHIHIERDDLEATKREQRVDGLRGLPNRPRRGDESGCPEGASEEQILDSQELN